MSKEKISRTSVVCISVVAVLLGAIGNEFIQVKDSDSTYAVEESTEYMGTTTCVTTTGGTTTTKMETTTCTTTTTAVTTTTSTTTEAMATLASYATVTTTTVTECELADAMEQIDFIDSVNDECMVDDIVVAADDVAVEVFEDVTSETVAFEWNGPVITKKGGIVPKDETPSGLKETWYNLPMFGCLDLMGLSYDGYHEREDGVKTYNGYVMVASPDLEKWPMGTYIETTRGMGYVVDECPTGSLDIAVNW